MSEEGRINALLVIGSLGSGGAERVLVGVAGELAARGNQTVVFTASQVESDFYSVGHAVRRLTPARSIGRLRKLLRFETALFKAGRNSDVIVSFLTETNVAACITGLALRKPVIASERIHPAFNSIGKRRWLFRIALLLYRLPNVLLVVQSRGIADAFRQAGVRAVIIPNGVHIQREVPPWGSRPNRAIIVGSLSSRKRVSDALRAWSASGLGPKGWCLNVVGDGPLRADLENLASSLNIRDSVRFIGLSPKVPELLVESRIYVSCSDFEGTSNALLEAMSAGCACVVSDCPGDNIHVLQEGQGITFPVGDVQALAAHLERLSSDEETGSRLSLRAREAVAVRDWNTSLKMWCELIEATNPNQSSIHS